MAHKVLLIDDSKTQLDVMKLRLCRCGYEVETATNGLAGYNKVFSFITDIILSDIVMLDLDGYQFGDFILKVVARMMKESFRRTDMLYRYGGEEIAIIMPETSLENAIIPAERLREKIEANDFICSDTKINLTVSIGIATMKEVFNNQKEIVEFADKALYKAKQTGRNKVVVFDEFIDNI